MVIDQNVFRFGMDRYKFLYMDILCLELILDIDVHAVYTKPHLSKIFTFHDVVSRDELREFANDVQKV